MATEVEAKFRVDSHDTARARLRERGAEFLGRTFETNRIFDNSERMLLATDRGLRIRECRDERGGADGGDPDLQGPAHARSN